MNILVTLNSGYVDILCVMLKSLVHCHPGTELEIYVMNSSLDRQDFEKINSSLPARRRTHDIKICDDMLAGAPITDRYPKEMYYRIFAARFLPQHVQRVLYLDPDIVVLKDLTSLYNIDFGNNYFAAASHVGRFLTNINAIRLQMEEGSPYINSGVMMMNIQLLRQQQSTEEVMDYIQKNKMRLVLPDQDIISALYGDRIIDLNPFIYNMSERLLMLPSAIEKGINRAWIKNNSAIVHFCGRNKPWKTSYIGVLGDIFRQAKALTPEK